MKTLYLLRHAKSSWKDIGLYDHERPLNTRGKRDLPVMAHCFQKEIDLPVQIISSDAKRTKKTIRTVAVQLGCNKANITFTRDLYMADTDKLLAVIHKIPDQTQRLLICGHNPGLTDFINFIANANLVNLPTCSLAIINAKIDHWSELTETSAQLMKILSPKSLINCEIDQ